MKRKNILLYGGILGIVILLTTKRKEIMKFAKSSLLYAVYGGKDGYIRHLNELWLRNKDSIIKYWTPDKVKSHILRTAQKHKIPYGILYATIKAESGLKPVGLTMIGGGKFTAFGMGQVTVDTFIDLVQPEVNYMHEDLFNPQYGIDASAIVLKKKYLQAGNWYNAIRRYRGVDAISDWQERQRAEEDVRNRLSLASKIDGVFYI